MDKKQEVRSILGQLGMPSRQQSDMCCYSLLALLHLGPESSWECARNEWLRIHDMIQFIASRYHLVYAENSRETFRKEAMHHFRTAAIIEDNGKSTNSPKYSYRITPEALSLLQTYGSEKWKEAFNHFQSEHQSLKDIYASKKTVAKLSVSIDGIDYLLSPGHHNVLQKKIIEEFAPRFAPNAKCLYLGDTLKRDLRKEEKDLSQLGVEITLHDKMPDVVLYRADKNWIYFIECVTSVGPMSPERILELNQMTENVSAGKVFVTAFLNFKTFKKFIDQIAWETEVWIADMPDHMVHLNGDKFLGPHTNN